MKADSCAKPTKNENFELFLDDISGIPKSTRKLLQQMKCVTN